jgi:hypothetical protein
MDRITINAVVFREDELWVAQCLEYNLVSCTKELEDLPGELMRQIQGQVRIDLQDGKMPFADFRAAPVKYWELFKKASRDPRLPEPPLTSQVEAHLLLAA